MAVAPAAHPNAQCGRTQPASCPDGVGPRDSDEAALELLLTTLWMVITGRRMCERPSLHHLSAEQLIDFWVDPRLDASDQMKEE